MTRPRLLLLCSSLSMLVAGCETPPAALAPLSQDLRTALVHAWNGASTNAVTKSVGPQQVTSIDTRNPNQNHAGSLFTWTDGAGNAAVGLVQFDVAGIARATGFNPNSITGVSLVMGSSSTPYPAQDTDGAQVFLVTLASGNSWVANQVNATQRQTGVSWIDPKSVPGARRAAYADPLTFDVTGDVLAMLGGTLENNGWSFLTSQGTQSFQTAAPGLTLAVTCTPSSADNAKADCPP